MSETRKEDTDTDDEESIFDRDSEFAPEFPNRYSEEAEDALRRVAENPEKAAICLATIPHGMYYIFIPPYDDLVRFNYKPDLQCFKKDPESKDEDLIGQIHSYVSNGTRIAVVPKKEIDQQPTWD